MKSSNLESLIVLRCLAVMMVCFCHFAGALENDYFFSKTFEFLHGYGKYGVEIFFVISGFVIPFSLFTGRYEIKNYPKFLFKRFLRLHPPYLASLAITVLLSFLAAYTKGEIFPETLNGIFKSLFYLHAPAENPVYWSLKIEAEYYLFIGLFFYLIAKTPNASLMLGTVATCLLFLSPQIFEGVAVFKYLPIFFIGILTFCIYKDLVHRPTFLFLNLLLIIFCFINYGKAPAVLAACTSIFILYIEPGKSKLLNFTGTISYSIYLIHFPLGIKFINLMKPRIPEKFQWTLFFSATILSLVASWLLYRMIEVASEKWSKSIRYKHAADPILQPQESTMVKLPESPQ